MTKEKPKAITAQVPERFRDLYEGQWVKRTLAVPRSVMKTVLDAGAKYFQDDEIMAHITESLAEVILDWNLEGEDGPLPNPWHNPDAFKALAETDMELCAWVVNVSIAPIASLGESGKN